MKKIFKCTECGKEFTIYDCELPDPRTINDGTESERIVCDTCFDNMWDNGDITLCDSCGIWVENKLIHEESVGGYGFAPCPNCGRDVVDSMSREERLVEAESSPSYAVTMLYNDGDNATYLFPTEEKRSDFIDQWLKDQKEDGVYIGSSRVHFGERIVMTEGSNGELHRTRIIKSNVYR